MPWHFISSKPVQKYLASEELQEHLATVILSYRPKSSLRTVANLSKTSLGFKSTLK